MAATYVPPGVTVQVGGQIAIPNARNQGITCVMLGRAPKGPDYPTLCTWADAVTLFGDPTSSTSAGYDLPQAMRLASAQRQRDNNTPFNFLVCRVGVVRAFLNILDGTGNICFQVQGIGPFAGTAGTNLRVAVAQQGANVNCVQTITVNGAPTSGNLGFSWQGVPTSGVLAWTAATTAANLQANLVTIPALSGNITVGGSAGGPYTVTFNNALANTAVPLVTVVSQTYVGGTAPNTSVAMTTPGTAISIATITLSDNTTGSLVQRIQWASGRDNLSNNVNIANTINGSQPLANPSSLIQIAFVNGAAGIPATLAATALTGGYDGIAAGTADGTIATQLQNSLQFQADYIWAGFDAAAVAPALVTHASTALLVNQFRAFFVGAQASTTYASLSSTYLSGASLASSRYSVPAHPGFYTTNPINGYTVAMDAIYLAAIHMGIKAIGPRRETGSKQTLNLVTGLLNFTDLNQPLTQAQTNVLAAAGLTVDEPSQNSPGNFQIRDHMTTAPFSLPGGQNVFSQVSSQSIDDAFSGAMVRAAQNHIGVVFANAASLQSAVLTSAKGEAANLGTTIGASQFAVALDPSTNQPLLNAAYQMPYPTQNIQVPTSFVLGSPAGS